jgi:hypothetical protein
MQGTVPRTYLELDPGPRDADMPRNLNVRTRLPDDDDACLKTPYVKRAARKVHVDHPTGPTIAARRRRPEK